MSGVRKWEWGTAERNKIVRVCEVIGFYIERA